MNRTSLDRAIVERSLAESRERAQALILAGDVLVNGEPARRAASLVDPDASIVLRQELPYVSRGGAKLAAALDAFGIPVAGQVVLDVGASTGGFTDCLLQRGATRVYAVDVGYGQLHWRLRNDERVVVVERTNIRYLTELPELADGATVDVSFISLRHVLGPVSALLKSDPWLIALIKPQFEAGREKVGRGGVVRDPAVHRVVIERVAGFADTLGWQLLGLISSPLLGPAGNREFLARFGRSTEQTGLAGDVLKQAIDRALAETPARAL